MAAFWRRQLLLFVALLICANVSAQGCVNTFGQCGGLFFFGSRRCCDGSVCNVVNTFYSQCILRPSPSPSPPPRSPSPIVRSPSPPPPRPVSPSPPPPVQPSPPVVRVTTIPQTRTNILPTNTNLPQVTTIIPTTIQPRLTTTFVNPLDTDLPTSETTDLDPASYYTDAFGALSDPTSQSSPNIRTDEFDRNELYLSIALVVTGVLLLIMGIVTGIILYRRKKAQSNRESIITDAFGTIRKSWRNSALALNSSFPLTLKKASTFYRPEKPVSPYAVGDYQQQVHSNPNEMSFGSTPPVFLSTPKIDPRPWTPPMGNLSSPYVVPMNIPPQRMQQLDYADISPPSTPPLGPPPPIPFASQSYDSPKLRQMSPSIMPAVHMSPTAYRMQTPDMGSAAWGSQYSDKERR